MIVWNARYALFLEEGEDPLEVIKEKTKKPAEKSADAATKSGSVKPAEVKGKAGGAPNQPAAVKKTAVLKETQANVIKPTEQNKPREGEKTFLNIGTYWPWAVDNVVTTLWRSSTLYYTYINVNSTFSC